MTTLLQVPSKLIAGTTIFLSRNFPDFPASAGWTYALHIGGAKGKRATINGTANGDNFEATLTPNDTAKLGAGTFLFSERLMDAAQTEIVEVNSGTLTILPDLANSKVDARSHARRVLEAIEAVLEQRATLDQQSYQINGRALSRMTIGDLIVFRDRYREEVRREDATANGKSTGNVGVRFQRV